jgi:hypothetical protein
MGDIFQIVLKIGITCSMIYLSASYMIHFAFAHFLDGFYFALCTLSAFFGCVILSKWCGNHRTASSKFMGNSKKPALAPLQTPASSPRLPRLTMRLAIPSPKIQDSALKEEEASDGLPTSPLTVRIPSARKILLPHLRKNPPIVNIVPDETRRRSDMSLHRAKLRVGKALLRTLSGPTKKEVDFYAVRIDCSTTTKRVEEKHMNPVVMWDITSIFDEFKILENEMKKELKAIQIKAKVPHLSSGGVFFVQRELTQHVLNVRREKIQAFMNEIAAAKELAELKAVRKFCQVF